MAHDPRIRSQSGCSTPWLYLDAVAPNYLREMMAPQSQSLSTSA